MLPRDYKKLAEDAIARGRTSFKVLASHKYNTADFPMDFKLLRERPDGTCVYAVNAQQTLNWLESQREIQAARVKLAIHWNNDRERQNGGN